MKSLFASDAADVTDKESDGLRGDDGEPVCSRDVLGTESEEARGVALAGLEWLSKVLSIPSCYNVSDILETVYYMHRMLKKKLSYHSNWLGSKFLQANYFLHYPKWLDHCFDFILG